MSLRLVPSGLVATALLSCAPHEPPDLVEQLTADLSRREGRPVEIGSIERMTVKGHAVACGMYAAPPAKGERFAALVGSYAAVDGRLVEVDAARDLVGSCLEKVFRTVAPIP